MAKVIKAKVMKQKLQTSKGVQTPWQVWSADLRTGFHECETSFTTEKKAEKYVEDYPEGAAVIVHINIPKMKY